MLGMCQLPEYIYVVEVLTVERHAFLELKASLLYFIAVVSQSSYVHSLHCMPFNTDVFTTVLDCAVLVQLLPSKWLLTYTFPDNQLGAF